MIQRSLRRSFFVLTLLFATIHSAPATIANDNESAVALANKSLGINRSPFETGQSPFDPQAWKTNARSKMLMIASALRDKSLIGWKKTEMDQSFDPDSKIQYQDLPTYYLAGSQRGGYALQVGYNGDVVTRYRIIKFDAHLAEDCWGSSWVQ
jgi:hypothetical protein